MGKTNLHNRSLGKRKEPAGWQALLDFVGFVLCCVLGGGEAGALLEGSAEVVGICETAFFRDCRNRKR